MTNIFFPIHPICVCVCVTFFRKLKQFFSSKYLLFIYLNLFSLCKFSYLMVIFFLFFLYSEKYLGKKWNWTIWSCSNFFQWWWIYYIKQTNKNTSTTIIWSIIFFFYNIQSMKIEKSTTTTNKTKYISMAASTQFIK